MKTPNPHPEKHSVLSPGSLLRRKIARILLGAALLFTGVAHVSFARATFVAQVPAWVPLDADFVVVASGVVELALGAGLILWPKQQAVTGLIVAFFFLAIFPGNISQTLNHIDAFGLNNDAARIIRLFIQPLLIIWALWSTGAWRALVARALR
ncbi:membrane protein [Alpinimonas psychrophila]|uniref:Putative membrane protein n=1 Tax=Alpinimonas psychrophila TaxID=748908 RepID=A0A7W3JRY9_9MICO|nr:hypothetical protein [Alpinimonas psychrophila]MBA8828149.1 putative membrane protein [Alpinimonas psychrophila]